MKTARLKSVIRYIKKPNEIHLKNTRTWRGIENKFGLKLIKIVTTHIIILVSMSFVISMIMMIIFGSITEYTNFEI